MIATIQILSFVELSPVPLLGMPFSSFEYRELWCQRADMVEFALSKARSELRNDRREPRHKGLHVNLLKNDVSMRAKRATQHTT
jgi:hypothetical protein